jgi:hypothetical protein
LSSGYTATAQVYFIVVVVVVVYVIVVIVVGAISWWKSSANWIGCAALVGVECRLSDTLRMLCSAFGLDKTLLSQCRDGSPRDGHIYRDR